MLNIDVNWAHAIGAYKLVLKVIAQLVPPLPMYTYSIRAHSGLISYMQPEN
jgi:hypothetical protein